LTLLFMFLVARDLFGDDVALIATFLMAISEFQIAQAQNFRYYSVFLLFVLISYLSWIRALRTGSPGYFAVYVLSSIAMFYSHTHGVFIVAAQGLYFVLMAFKYRPLWLKWLVSQVLILLGLLPGLSIAFGGAVEGTSNVFQWIPDPHWWQPVLTFMKFVFPARHFPPRMFIVGALLFGATALALFILWKGKDTWLTSVRDLGPTLRAYLEKRDELLLVACWLVLPVLMPLVLSSVFGPMYLDRYVIGASPALYIAIALVVVAIRKVIPMAVPLTMMVILIAPGLYEYYVTPTKEQWREAAAYIHQQAEPGDHFVFAPGENGAIQESLNWYYRAPTPGCAIEADVRDRAAIGALVPNCIAGTDRMWLVVRGAAPRVKPYQDFFLANTPKNLELVDSHHLKDIDLYLFSISRP
jgi:hypothetical protein